MISQKVLSAQEGSQDAMLELIKQFTPLLKRYSRVLYIEDSFDELVLAFIEIIHAIPLERLNGKSDGILVNYIAESVKNSYIALIRKNSKHQISITPWDELTESQQNQVLRPSINTGNSSFEYLLDSCHTLTEKERMILRLIYCYGYTSADLAKRFSSTKQNINQIKLRAQRKLKKAISS